MEPQQPTHLISKIWRKLPIQARLYAGRGSIDLDLEKDRTSFSRSSATKHLRSQDSDEYSLPSSPMPDDEGNMFGDKHVRFHYRVTYDPPEGPYVALESYDDVLVRVCQFARHDQRRTAVKVQEFLERSVSFVRGTTTRRGQKVSISNDEIRMWRRLARHDWTSEEITRIEDAGSLSENQGQHAPRLRRHRSSQCSTSVTEDETETDEDDSSPIELDERQLRALATVVNWCLSTGDSEFSSRDIEELVTLDLLVEEDGWI
ncbi:hypothetical protein PINS_up012793 [Pythium insidiosum]|nr:hypothetical protein PINS_up012793 [Pythium insidiosum]